MNDAAPIAASDGTVLRVHAGRPDAPIAVEVTRGGMVESVHRVIAAVVDADGRAVATWGDADRLVYGRSAIKPIQALPVLESGAAEAFGLDDSEVTLCCASHSGEPMHVERVVAWLDRLGLSPDDLDAHDDAAADHRGRLGALAVAAAEGDRGRVHVPLPAFGDGDVRDVARLGGGANRVVGAQGDHRLRAVARGAADGAAVEVPQVIRGSDELELVVGGSQPERGVQAVLENPDYRRVYEARLLAPHYIAHADYPAFIDDFAARTEAFLRSSGVLQ